MIPTADGPGRRLRRAWRRHRWQTTLAAAAGGAILGFVGVGQDDAGASVVDRAYGTLQLFFLAYVPVAGHGIPVALQVGRFLAPVAVAYAGLQAVAALFVQQASELRIRLLYRRHVIVCGLGRAGLSFAIAASDSGERVVAVDVQPSGRAVEECGERAIPMLTGDASERSCLTRAGVGKARAVVVTCGDDDTNGDVALALRAGGRGRSSPLACFVQIGDDRLCARLEEAMLLAVAGADTRIEFFNVHRSGPQALLDAYARLGAGASHLYVLGSSEIGTNLVIEAARRAHHGRPGLPAISITLAAPDAPAALAALKARYPSIESACQVDALVADLGEPPVPASGAAGPVTVVFVCSDDDSAALRAALHLRHDLSPAVPIVVCTTRRASSVAALIGDSGAGLVPNVHSFAILEEVCTPEVVFHGLRETIARAFHADYADRQLAAGADPGDPSVRPWEELPEILKQSNRDLAADIGSKLSLLGCGVELMVDWDAPRYELTAADVARLAPLEHERWSAERRRQGWVYGPVRDVEARTHPDLVPWDQLTEEARQKDADNVRLIPAVLATYAGLAVVPRGDPEASG